MDWLAYIEAPIQEIFDDLQAIGLEEHDKHMKRWTLEWFLKDTPKSDWSAGD